MNKEEIEPIFNPNPTILKDSKDSNHEHSIFLMPIVLGDERMINDFIRIRSQGSEGSTLSSKEYMKYYGGGIKNKEQSKKECESRMNGMWMNNSLPLEMVFLVYDKEKE